MMNMPYCRFENTFRALEECQEALQNNSIDELKAGANQYEHPYIENLIQLCVDIANEFGEDFNEED